MTMNVCRISAITIVIENMERSCRFYSQIPGFRLVHGGRSDDAFTSYEIGKYNPKMYFNLEVESLKSKNHNKLDVGKKHFGRIIFFTEDVDKLYQYLRNNKSLSKTICFEDKPMDATWGERYFHIR